MRQPGRPRHHPPVIDLAEEITNSGYGPSERLTEQITLRDKTCIHAYCNRPARYADKDHTEPYDPDGPPDQTTTSKLACLCRSHHRLKTHGSWTYKRVGPDSYIWTSPHGYQYLRDGYGTEDLTEAPVEPPGS